MDNYCLYETSLLLKWRGFKWKCTRYCEYTEHKGQFVYKTSAIPVGYEDLKHGKKHYLLIPTHTEAIRWIDRYCKITITVKSELLADMRVKYTYQAVGFAEKEGYFITSKDFYRSMEVAEDKAIKRVLEDLRHEQQNGASQKV